MELSIILFFCIAAYLLGSIPFGLIVTKLFLKKDIREIGSGNIGATNVLRTGSKFSAVFTLSCDFLKGVTAIVLGAFLLKEYNIIACKKLFDAGIGCFSFVVANAPLETDKFLYLGLLAIIGHCFPIWLKFKGGKGVATTLGVLLAAVPFAGLAACGIWLASAFAFKISSLAALIAIGITPIIAFFIYGAAPAGICALIALLVFWRHKENIQRLLKGEEPKIGAKKDEQK